MSVNDARKKPHCLNGNRYKICEANNGIVITQKTTNKEIFRSCNDEITGNLKVKDIEIFQKASNFKGNR